MSYIYEACRIQLSGLSRSMNMIYIYFASITCKKRPSTSLQRTVTHCDTLQHTATHCNTQQHTVQARHCDILQDTARYCKTLQHTATHCNTVQHTAAHCNTLQQTATHCNAQHIYNTQTDAIDIKQLDDLCHIYIYIYIYIRVMAHEWMSLVIRVTALCHACI